jgi:hypothetical protein
VRWYDISCVADGPDGSIDSECDVKDEDSVLTAETGTSTGLLGWSLGSVFGSSFDCCAPICGSVLWGDGLLVLELGDG